MDSVIPQNAVHVSFLKPKEEKGQKQSDFAHLKTLQSIHHDTKKRKPFCWPMNSSHLQLDHGIHKTE